MPVRLACPDEAEILWEIRNQAIRHGCKNTYGADIVMANADLRCMDMKCTL